MITFSVPSPLARIPFMCYQTVCLEEVGHTDGPLAVLRAHVVEFDGLDDICHAPRVLHRYLPALEYFEAAACRESEVAARTFEGVAGSGIALGRAVGHSDGKIRTAVDERSYVVFQSVHAGPLKAYVQRNLQIVYHEIRILEAVYSPYVARTEVGACAHHVIQQSEIDAEANTREHQFSLYSCLESGSLADGEDVLLEFEIVHRDACNGSVAEFRM